MAKAADAFRTISEVAEEIGIPKHVLRFWEVKFPQVRPMKRGGGRRFYRPEDLELLRGICQLLHNEGYTIKGVQKILRRDGVEAVKSIGAAQQPGASPAAPAREGAKSPPRAAAPEVKAQAGRGRRGAAAPPAPLPPHAKQAIKAVLDDLAAIKALLLEDAEPANALRGAA